jgi:hypothetical protein
MARTTLFDKYGRPNQKIQAGESTFQFAAPRSNSNASNQLLDFSKTISDIAEWGSKYAGRKLERQAKESGVEGKAMALDAINKGYKAQLEFSKYLEEQQGLPNGLNPLTIKSAMMWNARGFAMSDHVKEALETADWYELGDDDGEGSATVAEYLRDAANQGKTWSETAEELRANHLQPTLEGLMDQLPQTESSIDEGFQPAIADVIAKKMDGWKKIYSASVSIVNKEAAAGVLGAAMQRGEYLEAANALIRPKNAKDNPILSGVAKGLGDLLPVGSNPDAFFFDAFNAHVHGDLYPQDPNAYLYEARLSAALTTTKLVRNLPRAIGGKIGEGTTKQQWNALEAQLQSKLTTASQNRERVASKQLGQSDEFHEMFIKDHLGRWLAENHTRFSGMPNVVGANGKLLPNYSALLAGFDQREAVLKAFMKDAMDDKLKYEDGSTLEWDVQDPDDDTLDNVSSPPQFVFDQSKRDIYGGLNRGFESAMEFLSKTAGMSKNAKAAQLALYDTKEQAFIAKAINLYMRPSAIHRLRGGTSKQKWDSADALKWFKANRLSDLQKLATGHGQPNFQNRGITKFLERLDELHPSEHVEPPKLKWSDTNAIVLANLPTLNRLKSYEHRIDWVIRHFGPRMAQDEDLQNSLAKMTTKNKPYWDFRNYEAEGSTATIFREAAQAHPDMDAVVRRIAHANQQIVIAAGGAAVAVPAGTRLSGRAKQLSPYEAKFDAYMTEFLTSSFDPDFRTLADAEGWASERTIKFAKDSLQHKNRTAPVMGDAGQPHATLGNGHLLEFIDLPTGGTFFPSKSFRYNGTLYTTKIPMLSWDVILHHDTLP